MGVNKIELSDKFVKYLENQPEQGMGYQIVDILLKDGIILKERIIINSTFLQLEKNENIVIDDIVSIIVKTSND